MKSFKFTFKRQPIEKGLASVARPYPDVHIKLRGAVVGCINAPTASSKERAWQVRFMVTCETSSCGWVWRQIKGKFASEEAARQFVIENNDAIQENIKLQPAESG